MRISFRALLLIGAATVTMNLHAQMLRHLHMTPHDVEVAPAFNAVHSNISSGGSFWQYGASMDGSASFYHGLGLVGSFAGVHASNIAGRGADLTMLTYLIGSRYTLGVPAYRMLPSGKLALFGQLLIGGAHGDGVFPSPQGALNSANSFALQLGGGVDVRITKRVAVRPIQIDWLRTNFPSITNNAQGNVRLSAGVVFRLSQ